MIKRLEEIEDIMKGLSVLQYYIKFSSNKLRLHNINKACEPFYCELFNVLWDVNYKRLESERIDYPGIDLGDKKNKLSMQITTDGSNTKLWKTIEQFEKDKLYKKYNVLNHFIVGEKHFSNKKLDSTEFKKGKYNMFFASKTVENYEYQIVIMDLMDLLRIIDEQDSKTVSEVHHYLQNNINLYIEPLRRILYNIEPDELKSFTAQAFIDDCDLENHAEEENFFLEIKKFANVINELDENNRRFLYAIFDIHCKYNSNSSEVIIDPKVIQRLLQLDDMTMESEISVLKGASLVDDHKLNHDGMLKICYYDSANYELLGKIYKYCIDNEKSFKDLILRPDFTILD
ncbi:SMEK domain-containing protein [Bacillus cereus]|uniref:SMEK domain-containing protein n=1 Tax=Bacillus cereus TaxID=1396 RepID=UPI0025712D32|nr:SMEK domain-containing protein [Bacillus cereus]WJE22424.1 SMEK domain-containing protein [Bacillus cereus]